MNKAYRLIWNRAKDAWVIAAEIVKGNGGPPSVTVCAVMVAASLALAARGAQALPTAPTVINGAVAFGASGTTLTVTNSPNSIINWQAFSIAANETVRFNQQSAFSAVLNRITGLDPSLVLGSLQSNGKVFLINPNGIIFGQGSRIDVGGLVASSLGISNQDFLAGSYRFSADSSAGAVKNQGAITTTAGGMVWLISPDVENSGIITTPSGSVMLAAGQSVHMVDPRNPEIAVVVSAPVDQAVNIGSVLTQGGSAGMFGSLVRQQGIIKADSAVAGENGRIFLKSTVNTTLTAGSVTSASGVDGGSVTIQSTTGDTLVSGSVRTAGSGGTGGNIQILGSRVFLNGATVDASGATGGGSVLAGGDYQGRNPALQQAQSTSVSADSIITADALFSGDGGTVVIWSGDSTRVSGSLSARGGAQGGNGGLIETSGHLLDFAGVRVNASAARGSAGLWLIDPTDVAIGATEAASIVSALNNTTPTNVTVTTSSAGPDQGNISVDSAVIWTSGASLTLTADSSVFVNSQISGGGPLSISGNGTNSAPGDPGVRVSAPVSAASVTITGRGANGADCTVAGCTGGNGGAGVVVNSSITANGDITITGFGGNGGNATVTDVPGSRNSGGYGGAGVDVSAGSYITSNGDISKTIRLTGTGGTGGNAQGGAIDQADAGSAYGGSGGHGILLKGQAGTSDASANVVFTGTGGSGGNATGGFATGTITNNGRGGYAAGGSGGHGIYLYGQPSAYGQPSSGYGMVLSGNGSITLRGTGAKGGFGTGGGGGAESRGGYGQGGHGGRGLYVYNSAQVASTYSGVISQYGKGGDGGSGTGGSGVLAAGDADGGTGGQGIFLYGSRVYSRSGRIDLVGIGGNGGNGSGFNGHGGNGGSGVLLDDSSVTSNYSSGGAIFFTGTGGRGGLGSGASGSYGGSGGTGIHLYSATNNNLVRTDGAITLAGSGGSGGGSSGGAGGAGGYGLYLEFGGSSPFDAAISSRTSVDITGNGGGGGIGGGGNGIQGMGVQDAWAGGEGAVKAPAATVTGRGGINLTGELDSVTLTNSVSGDIIYTTANYGYNSGLVVGGVNSAAGGGFSVSDASGGALTVTGITTANGKVTVTGDTDVAITGAINAGTGAVAVTAGSGGFNGSITGLTGLSSVNAGSATLSARDGIGTTANPFITAVNSLAAYNNYNAPPPALPLDITIKNTGALSVTALNNNAGSITLDNVGAVTLDGTGVYAGYVPGSVPLFSTGNCNVTVTAHSPLTVTAPVWATGDISLTAGASGSPQDSLLIGSTSSVSAGQNAILTAGNLVTMNSTVLVGQIVPPGTLTINQGLNPAAPPTPPGSPLTTQSVAFFINEVVWTMGREAADLSDEGNEIYKGGTHGGEVDKVSYCN